MELIWIKICLLCMIFIFIIFMLGSFVSYILDLNYRLFSFLCLGFITLLAIFQLVAFPFAYFQGSFFAMTIIYIIIVGILLFFSIHYFFKKGKIKDIISKEKVSFLGVLITSLVLGQVFLSAFLYHGDDDDAYFITVSSTTIETGILSSDTQFVSTGLEYNQVDTRSNTATWEYFIALLSFIFNIKPAIVAHTVLPILLIPLSYLAIYQVSLFLINEKARLYFMLIYTLLNFFGGYTVYSTAAFLLLRIWQGKAVLACIIFPMLLANCIELITVDKCNRKHWILNAIILIAGVNTSVIGVYLPPIYYLIILFTFMYKVKWKEAKRIIVLAIFSLIPCAIFTLLSFIQVISNNREYFHALPPNWADVFKNNMLSGYYIIFYVLALVYTIFKGNSIQKITICGITMFAFLTFLNPLFCMFVSQNITGVDVYWRLYWTLPIFYAISFMLSDLMIKFKNSIFKILYIAGLIICINFMGYFIYQEPYYTRHENIYKIPSEVINIVDFITENDTADNKPNVLFPEHLAAKARQYSTNVTTVWSRWLYQGNNLIPNSEETLSSFYYPLYNGELQNIDYIIKNLNGLNVEWLVVPETLKFQNDKRLNLLKTLDGYSIYKVES